ncbi:Serine/threonine/tyrosine-protein kinase HT1 [Camellia lanceoleosa]|uniref:Serine/threonine/tyrosine-protein kinase HT1 n=1 Tax=Camellia lanceoleosa TaxID=1840588 RepID=A0ACC0J4Z6_9ERIC|nr:Serine/threonine/tyrosine-protein kinase HT1 [Camellia lanceoleosa]
MKKFHALRKSPTMANSRRLSLGEYERAVSWSKDVAIKLISQPREDGHLAALREAIHSEVSSLFDCSILISSLPPLPSTCPVAFRHFINRCWSSNPNKRPHFEEIVNILEGYAASIEQDPEFFLSYSPSNDHILFPCLPKCIAASLGV